jgi:hypothetical protein
VSMIPHDTAVKAAVLAALRADATVTAIVPVERIVDYVTDSMTWPFIRVGTAVVEPYEATGVVGGDVTFTVHGFARGFSGAPNATVKTKGPTDCETLARAIVLCLDEAELTLDDGYLLSMSCQSSQVIPDIQKDSYHAVVEFDALTGEE